MEPTETPSQAGTASSPDRADAAQRKLAEIWGNRDAAVEVPAEAAEPTHDPGTRKAGQVPAAADAIASERTLAEIWEPRPESARTQLPMVARREQQDARFAELRAELSERSATLGPSDPTTIELQLKLATTQLEAGRFRDAIPVLERAVVAIDSTGQVGAALRATVTATLAGAYLSSRQTQLAIQLYESLLTETAGVSTASDLLGFRVKLATAHRAAGNVTASVDQLGKLRAELQSNLAEQARLLEATLELATTNVVAGRPRDATTIFQDALPLAHELHGPDDRTTLSVRLKLAQAHHQAGQVAEAISVCGELVTDAQRALGPRDRLTEQAATELGLLQVSPPST